MVNTLCPVCHQPLINDDLVVSIDLIRTVNGRTSAEVTGVFAHLKCLSLVGNRVVTKHDLLAEMTIEEKQALLS